MQQVKFFFMSLWLLFVLVFLLTIDIPLNSSQDLASISLASLLEVNWLAALSLLLAALAMILALYERYKWSGVLNHLQGIECVRSINYQSLVFVAIYITPLACLVFADIRYVWLLVIILVATGAIMVKTKTYYGNPTLALLGYKFYRAKLKDANHTEVILISKDVLSDSSLICWLWIDKAGYLMFAKEIDKR